MQIRNAFGTLSRSFMPLRQSNFRTYLGGQAISLIGTWMQPVAALLVGFSAQQLGAVAAIRINGGLIVLLIGAFLTLRPALRSWRTAPSVQAKSAV